MSYEIQGESYVDYIKGNGNLAMVCSQPSSDITVETAKKSVVRLFVYYDSLSCTQIDESPQKDFVALVVNIGNLGLFLGVVYGTIFKIYFF